MRKKQKQEVNLQNQFNDFKEDDIRILKKKSKLKLEKW